MLRLQSRGESIIDSTPSRFEQWRVQQLLVRHPTLRIVPDSSDELVLAGEIAFAVLGPNNQTIQDCYSVEIRVPQRFPFDTPAVRETGGRIAESFHKLKGDFLCLGTPTELRLLLVQFPSLLDFVERAVVPYLFGHTYYLSFGVMPLGERPHGVAGLLEHFASLFETRSHGSAREFVRLAALRRRRANKIPCACGSERRLGRCHNKSVNSLRALLGRSWLASQLSVIRAADKAPVDS